MRLDTTEAVGVPDVARVRSAALVLFEIFVLLATTTDELEGVGLSTRSTRILISVHCSPIEVS